MKNILLSLLALVVGTLTVGAQSLNINHSGIQTTYNANDISTIDFSDNGATLSVQQGTSSPLTVATADVTSIESSAAAPNFQTKYADGEPAQVVFSCIEVNNTNPLQTLNFKLEKANKYLFDAVILFSSNINFSKRDNEVYIHNNENVQPILNHSDHYIKPLKDRGIKVLLSILGNHDGSGLANMSDERCRDFAKASADTLDKYDLDGVFFDDEYSEYEKDLGAQGFDGFSNRGSAECASRLAYETKKAIGDRWVVSYRYGKFSSLKTVDDVQPGGYVDYILNDYGVVGVWNTLSSYYPGATKQQFGVASINVNGYTNFNNVKRNRTDKYGAFMIYNLDQESAGFETGYRNTLNKAVQALFDDTILVEDTHYKKDWTPIEDLREPNRP